MIGSILTGVIGLAIAVACAVTLHRSHVHIENAADVALALRPLAGSFATLLFGASLLAAAIVPLATAYSIIEGLGAEASLDLDSRHFQLLYAVFVGLTVAAVSVVSIPGLPLIPLIYSSQVSNAVLLPLHVIALHVIARDGRLMGTATSTIGAAALERLSILVIIGCVVALNWSWAAS